MKRVLAIVAVCLLVLNSYLVYNIYFKGNNGKWQTSSVPGEGKLLDDLTVVVPPNKLGDIATYDYKVYAEMYYKSYKSGNWSDYRLTIDGQLKHWYHPNTLQKYDGFWDPHNTLDYEMDTQASFTVYVASSGAQPLTILGSLGGEHHEYKDLTKKNVIQSYTKGDVSIDRLPRVNVPLSYSGILESYVNPNRPVEVPLDQQIYGDGQQISKDNNGTVVQSNYYSLYNMTLRTDYNWTADRAVMFKNFKTLHLNVSAEIFGGMMQFNEQLWLSSDSPFPIKRFSRTNQSFSNKNGTSFFVIETNNTLQEKGYTPGDTDIPWGSCTGDHWPERNPDGEFKNYNYVPVSGNGYSASSFDFKTEDADQFARQHSTGLQSFLAQYDQPGNSVTIISASYNASKNPLDVSGKAGSYRWNLTYGHWLTPEEEQQARQTHNHNFTYNIVLLKNVTKDMTRPLQDQYTETTIVENDWGVQRDSAALPREMLPSDGLTLAASENIMMKDPLVSQNVENKNGNIDWGNFATTYGIVLAGSGGETNPGYQMVEILTGITMPSADYAWSVQKGTVVQSGSTFTAAVDVNNGQLVYVMNVKGTALMSLFP